MPLSSITTPEQRKRLYIDPRMVPLLAGRRVALVDDVISSGASMAAGLALLAGAGIRPVVLAAAMLQSARWREPLAGHRIVSSFATPVLRRSATGWCS